MPPSSLAKVSMFPFSIFWRIDNDMQMKNPCGGLATIIALGILIAVSVVKFMEVFSMTTIIATSGATVDLEPPMINISTIQNNSDIYPYMFGLGLYQDAGFTSSSSVFAEYVVMTGSYSDSARKVVRQLITLQSCTANHFSVLPGIQNKSTEWGISSWFCLPLNQTYEIGGSYELSLIYKTIQLNVTCNSAQNQQDCGYAKLYTLNTFVDPKSITPATYLLSADTFLVKALSSLDYSSPLNLNTLVIDKSLLPTPSYTNITSTQSMPIKLKQTMVFSMAVQTTLRIEASGRTLSYKRSYLKILDALSFIGGIFQTILAVFFFMGAYNRFFFQMRFANEYFKTKETKDNTFHSWVRHAIQGPLKGTCLEPQWSPLIDRRNQIKQTVNKTLDVIYLNKRIAFLEMAITHLYEKHQLKGLHLMHSLTRDQAEQSFLRHKFRDRVIYYLHKNKKIDDLKVEEQFAQILGMNVEQKMTKSVNIADLLASKQMINEDGQIGTSNALQSGNLEGKIGEERFIMENMSPEMVNKRNERRKILDEQVEFIGEMEADELQEGELVGQFETDIKRLMDEAQNENEEEMDERSIRIYDNLDEWLKEELKVAIHSQINNRGFQNAHHINIIGNNASQEE